VRCYSIQELEHVVREEGITVGIISVPIFAAQVVADAMVDAGILGILNWVPLTLRVPDEVYVEQIDLTQSLEKVAYFAHLNTKKED